MPYEIDKTKLRALFDRDFLPILEEMEPYRRKKNRANKAQMYLFIGAGLVMIATVMIMFTGLGNMVSGNVFYVMCAVPFLFFVGRQFVSNPYNKDWTTRYKKEIAVPLVKFINSELDYQPSKGIPRDLYTGCGMFRHKLYSYSSEDLIKGKHGNVNFQFSDVVAKYETTDNDGKRTVRTDFEGVLLICDFNKAFNGEYVLTSDFRDSTWLGRFFDTVVHESNEIKLENPEFEQLFDLRGSDQVEGRYIFSHSMMDRVIKLQKEFGNIKMAFKNNQVYIALSRHFDILNHDFSVPATDFAYIEKTADRICEIIATIDTLNLNLDIWKRQTGD